MPSPFLLSLALFLLILVGADRLLHVRLPYPVALGLFLALQIVVMAITKRRDRIRTRSTRAADRPWRDWPTSGPIGRFGQTGLMIAFGLTGLLALLNPFQLVEVLRQASGNARIRRRLGRESGGEAPATSVEYSLPFDGEWLVYNGGDTPERSHSWDVLTQRYAYDFVVIGPGHGRHERRGTRLSDYRCYDLPILAAAEGQVVAVRGGIGDAPLVGFGVVDVLARSFLGNHIIIAHGPREFSLYAHLRAEALQVRRGDRVRRGQIIGRCGHSGHSSEPHLHFHVQDRADFFTAAGLPVTFRHIRVNDTHVPDARIGVGDLVANDGW